MENTIKLEYDEAEEFSIFLTWLITGDIERAEELEQLPEGDKRNKWSEDDVGKADARMVRLLSCFVLGDRILAQDFRNHIMDVLIANFQKHNENEGSTIVPGTDSETVILVYKNTLVNSPLRRLLLDNFIGCVKAEFGPFGNSTPELQEFYESLSRRLMKIVQWGETEAPPWDMDICARYHEHADKPEGYACK